MDNELQEETLFKVIHSLGPFNPKMATPLLYKE